MYYYEYWGLQKAPFDNAPDPAMYVASHTSAANAVNETLFAIEEGNECLAVIVGDVGLGKTMSLRMVIDSLDENKYRIAFVVNPDMPFLQFLKEIIGQLTGEQCQIRKKIDLLEAFNRILFETADQGKKVVIFVDEANAMSLSDLEKMRLLTNLQPDDGNLFTIVLAGQLEFAKRLAHPKRANLFQRVGTYCALDKIESSEMVKAYVDTRLALAGAVRSIFTDEAISLLWEHSDYGVPRLINKLAKLSLKAGETNGLKMIDGGVITQVAERFRKADEPSNSSQRPPTALEEEWPAVPVTDDELHSDILIPDVSTQSDSKNQELGGERESPDQEQTAGARHDEEVVVSQYGVYVNIPADVIDSTTSFSEDQYMKLAGVLAAQTIQKHPQLTASWGADPLAVWSDIREVILSRLRQSQDGAGANL